MEANDYLNQVVEQQARVQGELRQQVARAVRKPAAAGAPAPGVVKFRKGVKALDDDFDDEDEEAPAAGLAVDYRITGFWRKTVVVPPNVYVVHTRRGHAEPLHVGLGISFPYNPKTDAFLVVPAAVQTLLINAKCICAERQGVLVQAYVQWIVGDIRTAYRKLDFSDPADPMRIVNVQLREQAEAAIKDKVATLPIDAVLTDKQPIIEELTYRLRTVVEGSHEGPDAAGLGLKIVTVQIKEAVVSSTRLWENLQKPFRAEREKLARLAELEAQEEITRRELANRQARETAELEAQRAFDQLRARQQQEAYDREQAEQARRHQLEQEAEQRRLAERAATEKARRAGEDVLAQQQHELAARQAAREQEAVQRQVELEKARAELARLQTAVGIDRDNLLHEAVSARAERDVAVFRQRRTAENDLSEQHLRSQLIARLPEVAAALPKPEELRAVQIGPEAGGLSLAGLVASVVQAVEGVARNGQGNGAA
jgi:hypothetical protein